MKHKQQFESNENAKINCVFYQGNITGEEIFEVIGSF